MLKLSALSLLLPQELLKSLTEKRNQEKDEIHQVCCYVQS